MKMRFGPFAVLLALPALAQAQGWRLDTVHSGVHFSVRHMMVSTVRGDFTKMTGTVDLNESDLAQSKVEATIEAASVDTREPKRDAHLKGADFFDVEKFPTITFRSTSISKGADGRLKIAGDLTLRGVTKPVVLDADPLPEPLKTGNSMRMGTTATARINRKDFGMIWNRVLDAGGVTVSDEVSITIDVELVKPLPKP